MVSPMLLKTSLNSALTTGNSGKQSLERSDKTTTQQEHKRLMINTNQNR